ncbi:MAG: alpha/beta hydrolase [Bacilli bacterium]|nr:alpha/beta hydrolase [Bacilli bacterium]
MQMIYRDININYVFYNNKSKINLVYLHGWGQNIEMMMGIAKPFIKKHNVLIIDLPGFGLSDEPKEVWDVFEYADMVNHLVKKLKMDNPILIGHSFGGKVSLCYALKYKTKKLVLLASPYKKKIKKETFKMKVFKFIKKVPLLNKLEGVAKKYIGSTDYKNASEMMRKILVKHVNLDISDEVKDINCPTLLIWGTLDSAVDYNDGVELEKLIPNCGLVTYEGCTHYAYLERLGQTINVLNSFIGEDSK